MAETCSCNCQYLYTSRSK